MNEKEKKTAFKWLEKLKKVKHIEIYVAVIFVAILLLIYLGNFSGSKTNAEKSYSSDNLTVINYVEDLEKNLEDILSNIGGVSNVKVMITLEMTQVEVNESKINLSKFPDVRGVVVTAKGVNNTATKLKVLHAIEAVINVSNGNIEILASD